MSEQTSQPAANHRLPALLIAVGLGVILIATGVAVGTGQQRAARVADSPPEPVGSLSEPAVAPSLPPTDMPAPTGTPAAEAIDTPAPADTPTPESPFGEDGELLTPVPTRAAQLNTGNYPGPSEPTVTEVPPPAQLVPMPPGVTNILLLGSDKRPDDSGYRTDTIVIVSINKQEGTVNMLSLPRDLLVYVPGWRMNKINTVYARGEQIGWSGGGFGLMQETLLYNFGIYVGHYAMVDLSGFQGIVDALGGVEIPVDCAMQGYVLKQPRLREQDFTSYDAWVAYTDPNSGNWELYTLPVGVHELDGYTALWYARWRMGLDDFDRAFRQQQVLRAMFNRARQGGFLNIMRVPQLWREYNDLVETSMGLSNMLELAPVAAAMDGISVRSYVTTRAVLIAWNDPSTEQIDYYQLPNPETFPGFVSLAMQPPARNYVINNTVSVEVRNGTRVARLDEVAADRLIWNGIAATATGVTPDGESPSRTVIYDFTGREKTSQLAFMQRELRVLEADIIVQPDPNRTFDYLVILGENYTSCNRRPEQAPQPTLGPPQPTVDPALVTPTVPQPTPPPDEATPEPPEAAPPPEG